MNIAICISGHVRDYEFFSDSLFKKIIDPNSHHNIDIFFSTWNKVNSNTSFASTRRRYNNEKKIDISKILDIYNPKAYIVEEDVEYLFAKYNNTNHQNNPKNVISQFYKIYQVSQLLKSHIESTNKVYDLVFKTRFDINYGPSSNEDYMAGKSDLSFIDFKFENFDLNFFNVEHDWNHYQNWITDKIFVSNVEYYFKFAEIYKNFDEIVNSADSVVAENLIYNWLVNYNNIPIKKTFELRVLGWQNT